MRDIIIILAGLAALVIAVWQLLVFVGYKTNGLPDMWAGVNHLYISIVCFVVAVTCVVVYFIRHPRVEEEIHVTK